MYKSIDKCRICGNTDLTTVIDLGDQAISSRFPEKDEEDPPVVPLVLVLCSNENSPNCCGLVQLKHTITPSELYLHNYGYRSGLNNTMKNHLKALVSEITQRATLSTGDIVLDIGSNDCTLLKSYENTDIMRIGIDPTGNQFKEYYPADVTLVPDFFNRENYDKHFQKKARVVTSISMFYDLPDPLQFMQDVSDILADDGIWVMEQSYLVTMLERNSFDTLCHEHLEYYAFQQILYMTNKVGLKIIDVTLNDCNGGSFRVTITKGASPYQPNMENINKILDIENNIKLTSADTYTQFNKRCEILKNNLTKFLQEQKSNGRSIYIYGASTKGNTLLQYYGIDHTLITAAAERNVDKFGRHTPLTNIPIISEAEMRTANPDFLLVLPWHFKEEFLQREKSYLEQGGQYIFPLPEIDIICNRPKALVTGISGQIGTYLADQLLEKGYVVYGQTRDLSSHKLRSDVFYYQCDLFNPEQVSHMIKIVRPDHLFNLAAETNAITSIENPEQTLLLNGNVVMTMCEAIKELKTKYPKRHIKMVNVSSSELFKGYANALIDESNTTFYPKNPYAIGKITAYWTMRYFREMYGMFCSNAIIFNTESPLRKKTYVTKKIIEGVKQIRGGDDFCLTLGNIYARRDWVHASDVAEALIKIIEQTDSSEYVVATGVSHTIKEFVQTACDISGLEIEWRGTGVNEIAVCTNTDKPIVKISSEFYRSYESDGELVGDSDKMRSIGWTVKYPFRELIADMLCVN